MKNLALFLMVAWSKPVTLQLTQASHRKQKT